MLCVVGGLCGRLLLTRRRPPSSLRLLPAYFSQTAPPPPPPAVGSALLEEHNFSVPCFGGSLDVSAPFLINIKSLSATEHPNMDKAMVKVLGPSKECMNEVKTSVSQASDQLSVSSHTSSSSLLPLLCCSVELPMVHNVKLTASGGGQVDCGDLQESDFCHITTEDGDVSVSNLKTAALDITTAGGDVECQGAIQGRVNIQTDRGNVNSNKRFTGPSLEITTQSGNISVASCYSDESKFSTQSGDLSLRNLHKESYVAVYQRGNVFIQGLDGSTNVFVKKGCVELCVSRVRQESRVLVEEGDVTLKMNDNFPLKLCITALDISVDSVFSKFGSVERKPDNYSHYLGSLHPHQFSPTFQIIAEKGNVVVESQSWAASLGLKLPPPADSLSEGVDESRIKNNRAGSSQSWNMAEIIGGGGGGDQKEK